MLNSVAVRRSAHGSIICIFLNLLCVSSRKKIKEHTTSNQVHGANKNYDYTVITLKLLNPRLHDNTVIFTREHPTVIDWTLIKPWFVPMITAQSLYHDLTVIFNRDQRTVNGPNHSVIFSVRTPGSIGCDLYTHDRNVINVCDHASNYETLDHAHIFTGFGHYERFLSYQQINFCLGRGGEVTKMRTTLKMSEMFIWIKNKEIF